jgi:hypothetical protein
VRGNVIPIAILIFVFTMVKTWPAPPRVMQLFHTPGWEAREWDEKTVETTPLLFSIL